MASGQCVRILTHRGPLTNAFFAPRYKHLDTDKFHPRVIINTFEKKRHDNQLNVDNDTNAQVLIRCQPLMEVNCYSESLNSLSGEGQTSNQVTQNELSYLKRVNRQLYAFAVDKILNKWHS